MPSITFRFEDMDFEIAPGVWIPQALYGTAEIACIGSDVGDWWLDAVTIDTCGTLPLTLDHNSGNRELFAKIERCLRRHDETGLISDELREARYDEAEAARELWRDSEFA